MVKAADLKEELFIVLLPKKNDMRKALELQETISKHYNLYNDDDYPELHITLNRINKRDIDEAKEVIAEVVQNYQQNPIKIEISNLKCFCLKEKFLVLKVDETDSLTSLSTQLHQQLVNRDLSTLTNYEEWSFHMSLISNIFAKNPISDQEFNKICLILDGIPQKISTVGQSIEIWRPTLDKDKKVIASFKL
ncbi:2'-5' RNA ligase [Orenia metallireducens]|uniref:2'-5' RNA ligase n=1 Tax=Orenia metallireducens TaxID=1413210 RepID=A0A285HGB9_9FIRM|nr:2'-5' RNA ligase family protein [Orenia metallireducens]PRX27483.1 2'-5' RNA ligase [Orenia metallireducens]SNY34717.1 2'-5' RNA ligase [Orenia metallireducens]